MRGLNNHAKNQKKLYKFPGCGYTINTRKHSTAINAQNRQINLYISNSYQEILLSIDTRFFTPSRKIASTKYSHVKEFYYGLIIEGGLSSATLDNVHTQLHPTFQMAVRDGNRWSIECFFKAAKSFLKLGTEFQSRTYDAMVCHTAIVFTRYTILEWVRRKENDEKTYGELFFIFCEDIQDMDLTNALQSLMALFVEHMSALSADITVRVKSKVTEWMSSQAAFIQALFENICWES